MYQIEAFMRVSARYKTSVERKLKQETTTVTEIVALLQIGFEDVHKKVWDSYSQILVRKSTRERGSERLPGSTDHRSVRKDCTHPLVPGMR
jgi:hypothetical protein